MNPDLFFLLGLIVTGLAIPATLSAFSTSGKSFRPAILCVVIGGAMLVYATSQNTVGYSANDIPRILGELFG
ncbi:MAG: hypothetical protein AAGK37_08890 [Pseudomonadota bacterium]